MSGDGRTIKRHRAEIRRFFGFRASPTSPGMMNHRVRRGDLMEAEESSERLAGGRPTPQALVQARSARYPAAGKLRNPPTVAYPTGHSHDEAVAARCCSSR